MKYDVTFTEQAENDLRGIFEYIAFDLLSPENAAGQLDRIEEKSFPTLLYELWRTRRSRLQRHLDGSQRPISLRSKDKWNS